MSLEALVVVIVAIWVVMNFMVTPAVQRNILSQPSQSTLGGVFRLGLAEGISTTALILGIAGVVTLMSLWVLQQWAAATSSATSLESFDAAISAIQSVRGASVVAQSLGGATLLVLLSIAFVYVSSRARAAKVGAVIEAEWRAAIAEKLEQLHKHGEDLNIPAPLRELVIQIHEIEEAILDLGPETELTGHEEVELRQQRATLIERYLGLALALDGPVELKRSHIEPMSHRGTWGRIGAFFISTGLFGSLQGAARVAYIVGAALLLPASLVAVGSSSAAATHLASTLDQVESFRIGFTAAQARAAALKAFESQQPASEPTVADASSKKDLTADAASKDSCSDQDAPSDSSCDVIALQQLATMFERAYGDWLLPKLVPDGPRQAVARRALVRQAIVQSDWSRPDGTAGNFATTGDRTPPLDVLGTKDWRATRTVEIDAAALDSAYETPTRARFKAFVRSEVIDKHPAAWQRMKASIAEHGADFQRIPTQSQLAQQLALRAMGTLLGTAANDIAPVIDGALSAKGPALSIHTSSVDIQASLFLEKLMQTGDPVAASRRLSELPRLAAGFTEREQAQFQRLAPHIRAAATDAAAVLEQRPATLELRQTADFDVASVDAASAKAAEAWKLKKEALSSVKDYESLFPGGDPPASRGAGGGPGAGGGGGGGARDFVSMDRSSKNGGVVLGRPRESGPALDVRNLIWRRADGRISLLLETGQGTVVLNGFNPAIVHQSLVFAADDRKTAVTIVNTEVQAQKVLLHPAFVDTPLGCRIIALDKYVFDLTAQDQEVRTELTQARVQPLVYDYVVERNAQVIGQLIEADGIGKLNRPEERDARVSQLRLAIQEIIPTNGASVFATSLLKAAPHYFHSELVSTMASCAEAGTSMGAFDACVDAGTKRKYLAAKRSRVVAAKKERKSRTLPLEPGSQYQVSPGVGLPDLEADLRLLGARDGGTFAEKVAQMARQLEGARNAAERDNATEARLDKVEIGKLMPPTTHLKTVSGVRESKWKLDRDFRFARVSTAGERAALDFFVHLPASTVPWFRPGVEPWYSADFKWESAIAQAQPIRLSSIQQRIDAAIDRYFETPRAREEVPPFVQLIGLNRLFSAALSGDLGEQFPIEKLAELSRATARDVKFAPTPRWILPSANGSPRPALDPEFSELRKALRVDAQRGLGTVGPQGGAACPPI